MRIEKLAKREVELACAPRHIGNVWEVELDGGESTKPHQHTQLEEIYCCIEGEGRIRLAEKPQPLVRGEVIFVPRYCKHWLENPTRQRLLCLAVEPFEEPAEDGVRPSLPETTTQLERQIDELPGRMDQAEAIQQIVALFDTAGHLSELIEEAFGLDNEEGVSALSSIEHKIMEAVVEISRRYRLPDVGPSGFGGRLKKL